MLRAVPDPQPLVDNVFVGLVGLIVAGNDCEPPVSPVSQRGQLRMCSLLFKLGNAAYGASTLENGYRETPPRSWLCPIQATKIAIVQAHPQCSERDKEIRVVVGQVQGPLA